MARADGLQEPPRRLGAALAGRHARAWARRACDKAHLHRADPPRALGARTLRSTRTACTQTSMHDMELHLEVTTRKFEINQMVGMFMGILPQRLYEASLLAYMFGSLCELENAPRRLRAQVPRRDADASP